MESGKFIDGNSLLLNIFGNKIGKCSREKWGKLLEQGLLCGGIPVIAHEKLGELIISECKEELEKQFGYNMTQIRERCREKKVVSARAALAKLLYDYGNLSYEEIGRLIHRNRSSIPNLIDIARWNIAANVCDWRRRYEKVEETVKK